MNFNIIGKKNIFFIFSGAIIILSLVSLFMFGLKPGIDFIGGTQWQIKIKNPSVNENTIKDFLSAELNIKNFVVYPTIGNNGFLINLESISETDHQRYLDEFKNNFGDIEELRFESIGPIIGKELSQKAVWAVILAILGICFYIIFAFRKTSYLVSSFKYGLVILACLIHDIVIPIGFLVFLGHFKGVNFNISFVVALLTIMGYSVHDTIVVLDRIRLNLLVSQGKLDFPKLVNESVNQVMARSINTSLTTLFALLSLFFLGPLSLKYFSLVLTVGIIFGTYSSIFIAAPLLVVWQSKTNRR